MSMVAPPEGITPRSHWTTFEPSERAHVPWLGVTETNSMLAGGWSLALHSRSEGSTLVFQMVKVTGSLTATLLRSAVMARGGGPQAQACASRAPSASNVPTTTNNEASFLTSFSFHRFYCRCQPNPIHQRVSRTWVIRPTASGICPGSGVGRISYLRAPLSPIGLG